MDKLTRLFLIILYPSMPFLACFLFFFTDRPMPLLLTLVLMPITLYILVTAKINFPRYLMFFTLFTIYHICSVTFNNLMPAETNFFKFLLADMNVLACLLFFVIENTRFTDKFIRIMNRNILIIVAISFVVSIVQIKFPHFFVSPRDSDSLTYIEESRIFSIYSWINVNSLGITFPILISISLNIFETKKNAFPLIIISGIIVSFLTKARYVMISTLLVISQFFFVEEIKFRKKVYVVLIFFGSIITFLFIAKVTGYNIQQVIEDRIMEKDTEMGSANARIFSYYIFLEKFPENPILGVGPETREDVLRLLEGIAPIIHVGYLSYLYFYGLVGAGLFFLSIFYLLKRCWSAGKKNKFWGGFYGILSFCFANITMVYFNISEMGIILVVIYLRYFELNPSLKLPLKQLETK